MLFTSRLVAIFNLPLALVTGWLLWRSRDWPLAGDATIFHFIAGQMQMGAVPYRDIIDVNMPLTYAIHAAVVATGGMGDIAWRAFDLTAAAVLATLILMLLAPAGRAPAILAVLVVLLMHVLLGPYAAGQRDFLMSILAVAVALLSARAAEDHHRRLLYLLLAGALGMAAACIKPTGMLLLLLPALALKLHAREILSVIAGAAAVALAVFGTLAARGGLGAFVTMLHELLPDYASMGAGTIPETLAGVRWMGPVAGLALAAALSIADPKPPRVRLMIGLTVFGLIHLLVQRKGWSYHIYPLAIGLACWGAWGACRASEMARCRLPHPDCSNPGLARPEFSLSDGERSDPAGHCGDAVRPGEPSVPRGTRADAGRGQRRLSRCGARRNAAGDAAYPMVLSAGWKAPSAPGIPGRPRD